QLQRIVCSRNGDARAIRADGDAADVGPDRDRVDQPRCTALNRSETDTILAGIAALRFALPDVCRERRQGVVRMTITDRDGGLVDTRLPESFSGEACAVLR